MSAPLSVVWGIDILGSSLVIVMSFYALVLMRDVHRRKRDFGLYTYLYAQTIALAIFAVSRSVGHLASHVLVFSGHDDVWKALAPVSGSINSLTFVVFGVAGLLYANIRGITERVDALEKSRQDLRNSGEKLLASLREKDVLLKEVHHRVKNNMAVMSSLQNLQIRKMKDPACGRVLQESRDRIRSMALVHEKLYQRGDLSEVDVADYVSSLAKNLFTSHGIDGGRVSLGVRTSGILLDVDSLIPCGLIINELITNTLKYAFPDDGKGRIAIELREEGGGRLVLSVADDGRGLPRGLDVHGSDTLGLQLVGSLVEQLGGEMEMSGPPGTSFHISFPRRAGRGTMAAEDRDT